MPMREHLLIITLALVLASPVAAHSSKRIENTLRFALGVGSSVATHEASHYLAARLQGLDIESQGLGWHTNRPTTAFQMAGLVGNALSSEAILLLPRESWGSYFDGWLLTNIVEQVTYSTLRYSDPKGDFGPLSSSTKRVFATIFVAEALFAGYRMYRDDHLSIPVWFAKDGARPMIGVGLSRR